MSPDQVRSLRKELGLTTRELARAIDVVQETVLAWERGEGFPTKKYVDRMNKLSEKRAGGESKKSSSETSRLADPEFWELVRKLATHAELFVACRSLAEKYGA